MRTTRPQVFCALTLAAAIPWVSACGDGDADPNTADGETTAAEEQVTSDALTASRSVASIEALASTWAQGLARSASIRAQDRPAAARFGGASGSNKDAADDAAVDATSALADYLAESPYASCASSETAGTHITITYACEGDAVPVPVTGVVQVDVTTTLLTRLPPVVDSTTATFSFESLTIGTLAVTGGGQLVYVLNPESVTLDLDCALAGESRELGVVGSVDVVPDEECPTVDGSFALTRGSDGSVTVDASYDACGEGGCPTAGGSLSVEPADGAASPRSSRVAFGGGESATVRRGTRDEGVPLECGQP